MATEQTPAAGVTPSDAVALDQVLVGDSEHWQDGPPFELFARLRRECPVHWTSRISDFPGEAGFWSVTTADDVHEVSRNWRTYSSELGGITALRDAICRSSCSGRCSSGWTRRSTTVSRRSSSAGSRPSG